MILWLTCTHGRYKCLQRNLKCYLDQDYLGSSVMFICNSGSPLKLDEHIELPMYKNIHVDNCGLLNFQSVGEKYNHAIKMAMKLYPDITVVTSADDDDIFLPGHLSAGVSGMYDAALQNKFAYKPQRSYFRHRNETGDLQIALVENTLEPSIFVRESWLAQYGYQQVSIKYHQQWLDPLIDQGKILVDPKGKPTLVYNWGDNGGVDSWNIYKMSGAGADTQRNFNAHKASSLDMGSGILVPNEDNAQYYDLSQCSNY